MELELILTSNNADYDSGFFIPVRPTHSNTHTCILMLIKTLFSLHSVKCFGTAPLILQMRRRESYLLLQRARVSQLAANERVDDLEDALLEFASFITAS